MTSLDRHSILQELIDLAQQRSALELDVERIAELADQLRSADNVNAYYEQKHANESVRLMRDLGYCPTCGAEEPRSRRL